MNLRKFFSYYISGASFLLLCACSSVPYEQGAIWCNEPLKYKAGRDHFDDTHLDVARRGYLYALAAAYVLQNSSNESRDHWFELPSRMKEVDRLKHGSSGFEVSTFELRSRSGDTEPVEEIIVAFTGSNDSADWILTNIFFSYSQYELASIYIEKTVKQYPGKRIVVTGFSLGGALAGHVTKNNRTGHLISEAWLFNPSSKMYANDKYDKRIWVGAVRGEALNVIRSWPFEVFWPGVNRIGAPWNQNAQDYYLIPSFPIYGHYRWVLVRNILFVADYAHLQNDRMGAIDPQRAREPREILEASKFEACKRETAVRNNTLHGQKDEQEKATQAIKEQEPALDL